ncbi:hypothetical protein BpHYR1_035893 [Brachionus plicatilis]|uniref:DUF1295 domain-containing protein n=1 Tax=Brachionus plicatilis TaxID=10195 RepID=A0A3M7Q6L1_BRAPC|nr:hypothetical protein BpHYR1_035893 [Brachionus plicatilis]
MEFKFLSLFSDPTFKYFIIAYLIIALSVWILTLITDNHSIMDKLWPLLPMFYSFGFLYTAFKSSSSAGTDLSRLVLMTILITLWGLRLAYAFYRRGYYRSDFEDHRWPQVKKRFNYPQEQLKFQIYNFFFMALTQNLILLGYPLPMWYIQTNRQDPFNYLDVVILIWFVVFFVIEAVADEQQWKFQNAKYDWIDEQKRGATESKYSPQEIEDFERGFLVKGLFSYSRHPNYFGDIGLWWCIYAFTISAHLSSVKFSSLFNYSMTSTLLMSFLFQLSVKVTEKITAKKYPEYKNYQSKIGKIFPSFNPYVPKSN